MASSSSSSDTTKDGEIKAEQSWNGNSPPEAKKEPVLTLSESFDETYKEFKALMDYEESTSSVQFQVGFVG
jgi:hypothetical protein